jgi:hypothetical protein
VDKKRVGWKSRGKGGQVEECVAEYCRGMGG